MAKMEPYVYEWYEYLKQGKLMGLRCKECGTYEFQPVPVCNKCSSTEMEWVEISGDVEIYSAAYCAMGIYPYNKTPVVCVGTRLKEGPTFMSWIPGGTAELARSFLERPRPVKGKLEITQIDNEVYWPTVRIVED